MKIIQLVTSINEEASGPSYTVRRLSESLIDQGQEVLLATLDCGRNPLNLNFLRTFPRGDFLHKLGRSPEMLQWLYNQARSANTVLIHSNGLWSMPQVYPGRVASRFGVPYVVSPRGTLSAYAMQSGSPLKPIFWSLIQKPSLKAVTCFHATARSEYEDIRRLGFQQPVAIIPNGVDVPKLSPMETNDLRTLLFLGRIHQKKGLDMLLPAWKIIQQHFPEWRLRVVGPDNGGYLDKMQHLAAEMCLERVQFTGAIYGEQKWAEYRNADLFVLPTYSENFGMSVTESLAVGTPAIVTIGAPWSGLITHKAGWWIDIGLDPLISCLEETMAHLLQVLEAMGQNGREWMAAEYSWSEIANKMNATYQWMLGEQTKPDWVIED